jgi:hypothetical protein
MGMAAKIDSGVNNNAKQASGRKFNVMGTHPELIERLLI